MNKEFSQEKFSKEKKAIKQEEEREAAKKEMEELSELPDEEFQEKKKETVKELGIAEDRAEGFLKDSESFKKPKRD